MWQIIGSSCRLADSHDGESSRDYFDDADPRPHSPPTASGGAYYPPYPPTPGESPTVGGGDYTPYPDVRGGGPRNKGDYQPYVPQDYTGYAPPPPPPAGPPPPSEAGFRSADYPSGPAPPPGPPLPPAGPPPTGGYRPPPPDHTMERHRREHVDTLEESGRRPDDEWDTCDNEKEKHASEEGEMRTDCHGGRRSSEPTSSRLSVKRNGLSRDDSASSAGADQIEDLPDRFDPLGRPLDEQTTSQARWTTRQGTFHRQHGRQGGWHVDGAWQVSGTDGEAIDQLAKNVISALEGHNSWMGVLGDVLGSGLLTGTNERGRRPSNRAETRMSR
ncbi:hypothetical protein E4U21_005343 [Claviceps maximensis]|nr:hypothetical protein E4U21_005343 [Claviceps maximensis]